MPKPLQTSTQVSSEKWAVISQEFQRAINALEIVIGTLRFLGETSAIEDVIEQKEQLIEFRNNAREQRRGIEGIKNG